MEHVRHQLLEAGVLDPGDALGALEVGGGLVAAGLALAGVVDQELGHFAERPAFLAVVGDQADAAGLGLAHALLDAVGQVGPAGADVGAEDVRAVALVVHPAGQRIARVADALRGAEDIEGDAADGGQEHRQVRPGHQFGIHAAGLLEEGAAQGLLLDAEPLRDAGQMPDRIQRGLGHRHLAGLLDDLAVDLQPAQANGVGDLRQGEARLGHRDGGPDVHAVGQLGGKVLGDPVAPRIEGDDLARLAPLRVRADGGGGEGVEQLRPHQRIQRAGGDGQGAIDRVGAAVGADGVAVGAGIGGDDHRSPLAGGRRAPADRKAAGRPAARVGREPDVGCPVAGHGRSNASKRKRPRRRSPAWSL